MRVCLLTAAILLSGAFASGCHLVTDDFEHLDWYELYDDDEEVAGTDFCYDFYALLCLKLKQCYPDSMYQDLTHEECAADHYDKYCGSSIYETSVVNGAVANDCFDALAAWSCAEVDNYLQTNEVPAECQSPFDE